VAAPQTLSSVEGFSTQFSVAPGTGVNFKVKSTSASGLAQIEIYRLGYYSGMSATLAPLDDGTSWPIDLANVFQDNDGDGVQDKCQRIPNPVLTPQSFTVPAWIPADLPDCSNWSTSYTWQVPPDAVSGIYVARVFDTTNRDDASLIPFVVNEGAGPTADILYQVTDATWQAYNGFDDTDTAGLAFDGAPIYVDESGKCCQVNYFAGNNQCTPYSTRDCHMLTQRSSLYDGERAVSYNRPFRNRLGTTDADWALVGQHHFVFDVDLPLIRFLEGNGFSVGYAGSTDFESTTTQLNSRSAFLTAGHAEYVTGNQLSALEAAASAGTNMLFLAGNFAYFKTRYDPNSRLLYGYKELVDLPPGSPAVQLPFDTEDPNQALPDWSGVWRDKRPIWSRPSAQPARCSNGLTGVAPAAVGSPDHNASLAVPQGMSTVRMWRGTNCGASPTGCNPGTLGVQNVGFEMDVRADRYYEDLVDSQPAGLFSVTATMLRKDLSTLAYGTQPFTDYYDYSTPTASGGLLPSMVVESTLHRKASGALVFAAASFYWSHGLDAARDSVDDAQAVSNDVKQATVNLLADMGVQPLSLMGLQAAVASNDFTAPSSAITVINQASGVLAGTAVDQGGSPVAGVVAGVEVSLDNGATWHTATLGAPGPTAKWSYIGIGPGTRTPLVRSVDDSGNVELAHGVSTSVPASDGLSVTTVGGPGVSNNGVFVEYTQTVPQYGVSTITTGWTSVVPMNMDGDGLTDLLLYNATTGAAIAETATLTPGVWTTRMSIGAAEGWTSIVPMNLNADATTDLLSYNAKLGLSIYSVATGPSNPGAQSIIATLNRGDCPTICAQGWTSIVPMNINNDNLTDLLFYNASTGLAVYTVGDASAPFGRQRVVFSTNASPGFTSIVPMNINSDSLTDLLSYNAATGYSASSVAAGGTATSSCGLAGQPSCPGQQVVSTVNAAVGWTSIVPMNLNGDSLTDLISYSADSGLAYYSIGTSSGGQVAGPAQHGSTRWTSILPMHLRSNSNGNSDLLFYR